mmetsp:Transcript_16978/g.24382  ORF Transcript_16978/g.24382 Transcript_16978/m.24382 type:complete len:98 (+) Transcript_16978:27-320(+)
MASLEPAYGYPGLGSVLRMDIKRRPSREKTIFGTVWALRKTCYDFAIVFSATHQILQKEIEFWYLQAKLNSSPAFDALKLYHVCGTVFGRQPNIGKY